MWFSRKIFVAVTSACVVCVREERDMKQKVNLCDSTEYELNNYDRHLTNLHYRVTLIFAECLSVLTKTFVTVTVIGIVIIYCFAAQEHIYI